MKQLDSISSTLFIVQTNGIWNSPYTQTEVFSSLVQVALDLCSQLCKFKACGITKDPHHPSNKLFLPQQSGKSVCSHKSNKMKSFFQRQWENLTLRYTNRSFGAQLFFYTSKCDMINFLHMRPYMDQCYLHCFLICIVLFYFFPMITMEICILDNNLKDMYDKVVLTFCFVNNSIKEDICGNFNPLFYQQCVKIPL